MKTSASTFALTLDKSHSTAFVTQYAAENGTDEDSSIREGAWETGLFCCLGTNFGALLNAILGWCLPCVPIAQVAQRVGVANYWLVLLALVVLAGVEYIVQSQAHFDGYSPSFMWSLADVLTNAIYTAWTNEELHPENIYRIDTAVGIHLGYGMWALVGVVPGVLMVLVTWRLRVRVRTQFAIPGFCCIDFFAACFCSCCTVAQLARHVQIPKRRGCNIGPVDTLPAFSLK